MLSTLKELAVATLTVHTLQKGAVEVAENQLTTFVTPLLGFPQLKRWLFYQTKNGPTYWIQSVEDPKVSFCVIAPFQAGLDPEIDLNGDDVADIGAKNPSDIDVYTMVVLDTDPAQRRTNLRAPILVCRSTNLAKQVILQDTRLPIKFYLRDLKPHGN